VTDESTKRLVPLEREEPSGSMQYTQGAPALDDGGLQIAGAAEYGPLVNGGRQEGSDFNDYLDIVWHYEHGVVDKPEAAAAQITLGICG
jgi:hypothetical protein